MTTAYFVAHVDFKQDPPVIIGAAIYSEPSPTIPYYPFVLMEVGGVDWEDAREGMKDMIRGTAELVPSHPFYKWITKYIES